MTQENKELLLKDLCVRMPYGVICHYNCVIRCDTMEIKKANCVGKLEGIIPVNDHIGFIVGGDRVNALFDDIKPYLRPMSSMTEEEKEVFNNLFNGYFQYFNQGVISASRVWDKNEAVFIGELDCSKLIDWLNAHYFDYRNLIEKGLAIAVTEENNPYEN